MATTLTRGLEAVGPYLTGYVPALVLSVVVIPVLVVVMAWADLTSAVIVVITLPLIPVFMILIGLMTRERTADRLDAMSRLSSQLLDLIAGIPTLRALGRERDPAARVRELGQAHRKSTMAALRVAFLSGAVLEFLATLSVALVAVSIGLRLVFGEMGLYGAVLALILAPEVYLPLRSAGADSTTRRPGSPAPERCSRSSKTRRPARHPRPVRWRSPVLPSPSWGSGCMAVTAGPRTI